MTARTAGSRRTALAGRYLLLAAASLLTVGPLAYLVLTSLRANAMLLTSPLDILSGQRTLDNYARAWGEGHLGRYFLNSVLVATATTVLTVFLSSLMAYAFARFDFVGKRVLFSLLLVELMVPIIMLVLPQFLLARDLRLLDSLSGLVLFYVGAAMAFNTFLLRGFFESIPREIDEAMIVDGAGAWTRYWRLILPLGRPALATAAIFAFFGAWDEYVWAVTTINDPEKRTLPIGIALFGSAHSTNWGLVFAASVISLIPVLIVFLAFQRQFVSGITTGAVKS